MEINVKSLVVQISAMFLVFAAALFLSAGTINWLPGWIFLAMFFGFVVAISLWLFKHDSGLASGAHDRVQIRSTYLG